MINNKILYLPKLTAIIYRYLHRKVIFVWLSVDLTSDFPIQ